MIDMVSMHTWRYAGRALKPGDRFQANPRDVRVLVAVGRAVKAPAEPIKVAVPAPRVEAPRAVAPAPQPVEPPADESRQLLMRLPLDDDTEPQSLDGDEPPPAPSRRTYRRRDQTAEG